MYSMVKRWLPLLTLSIGLFLFFYFDLSQYFNFVTIKKYHDILKTWTNQHFLLSYFSFMAIYLLAVAISFPGASFLTIVAGFLFGIFWGTLNVVLSASLGALCIFLAVKNALAPWLTKKTSGWLEKMRTGFQRNAIQYLLILRLIPIFPFWVVNIIPALFNMQTSLFFITTFFGIMPGSFVYVLLGDGLGNLFITDQTPNLNIIFTPAIFIPLVILALLSFSPTLYHFLKTKKERKCPIK